MIYIDEKRDFYIFKFSGIEKYGCIREFVSRFRYVRIMVERFMIFKLGLGRVRLVNFFIL